MVNAAGFVIHSAIHMAREDAGAVLHLHTPYGQAVSAMDEGLLPQTQTAMIAGQDLAYHDYEGIATDLEERERLVADLGDKHVMILRNHGTLTVGENDRRSPSSACISSSAPARRRSTCWPPGATISTRRRRARREKVATQSGPQATQDGRRPARLARAAAQARSDRSVVS